MTDHNIDAHRARALVLDGLFDFVKLHPEHETVEVHRGVIECIQHHIAEMEKEIALGDECIERLNRLLDECHRSLHDATRRE